MNKYLSATICKVGTKDVLKIDELGLDVESKQTVGPMCRKIMDLHPEYADYSIEVYRDGRPAFSVINIGRMATKIFVEEDSGIRLRNWSPHPFAKQSVDTACIV